MASFTYHGFRYVEVTGVASLKLSDITQVRYRADGRRCRTAHRLRDGAGGGLQVHFRTDNTLITNFSSSSHILNTIQYGAYRGQGSNMMSVPTGASRAAAALSRSEGCCAS
jgi:hypothetical protein